MKEKRTNIEMLLVGVVFTFYILITCYKLTNAPLWYDETVEFWYSKIMFGKLPFEGARLKDSTNMYQRIVSTFQPPLYNVIMYFWLKISTTEWWFRFFGVVMGAIGNVAIYKTVKKTSNGVIAALSVLFSSCVYKLVYYWQECAEYCLMLGTICWTINSFICLLEKQNLKNIALFTILSILPVYSQYGAAFPVASMLIIAYIYIYLKKDKKNIVYITISYFAAFVFAAIPLFYFFIIKQMRSQQNQVTKSIVFTLNENIFIDMFKQFKEVVSWNLFSYYNELFSLMFSLFFIICIVVLMIFSKRTCVKILSLTNIGTWFLYYIAVKLGLYSYGSFGARYNLFFIPLWIISLFCFGYQIYIFLKSNSFKLKIDLHCIFAGISLTMILCFMVYSWNMKLQPNWSKEDMRTAVNKWLEYGAQNSQTIVYYGGNSGFAYYLRENDNYSYDMERNVNYMPLMRSKTVEEYTEYINSVYENDWPKEIYIIGTHTLDDINTLASSFTNKGYVREDLCSSNCSLMRLLYTDL